MVNTFEGAKPMKETKSLVYEIDDEPIGVANVEAETLEEAVELVKEDFTSFENFHNFEITETSPFDDSTTTWNAYFRADGKKARYDGVWMVDANDEGEANQGAIERFKEVFGNCSIGEYALNLSEL